MGLRPPAERSGSSLRRGLGALGLTIVILYAIRPMLDTLNRLATWIDNLPGMQDFLNPRCGQPICFGQSPAAYVIVVVSFLSILLFCSLGIARVRRRAAHAHGCESSAP